MKNGWPAGTWPPPPTRRWQQIHRRVIRTEEYGPVIGFATVWPARGSDPPAQRLLC